MTEDSHFSGYKCFYCGVQYTVRPSEHICPDGTTYRDRVNSVGGKTTVYDRVEDLKLTPEDIKLLHGMKIKFP